MTDIDLLTILKTMVEPGDTDDTLFAYLLIAKHKIINRLYPYGTKDDVEVPNRYRILQAEMAAYMLNKRGAEGETAHRENGINRTYDDADIPKGLLSQIVPYCGTIGQEADNESAETE